MRCRVIIQRDKANVNYISVYRGEIYASRTERSAVGGVASRPATWPGWQIPATSSSCWPHDSEAKRRLASASWRTRCYIRGQVLAKSQDLRARSERAPSSESCEWWVRHRNSASSNSERTTFNWVVWQSQLMVTFRVLRRRRESECNSFLLVGKLLITGGTFLGENQNHKREFFGYYQRWFLGLFKLKYIIYNFLYYL